MEAFVTQLVVAMLIFGCTTVIGVIGFLLSYQLKQLDTKLADYSRRIRAIEIAWATKFGHEIPAQKRPSDTFKVVKGDQSA